MAKPFWHLYQQQHVACSTHAPSKEQTLNYEWVPVPYYSLVYQRDILVYLHACAHLCKDPTSDAMRQKALNVPDCTHDGAFQLPDVSGLLVQAILRGYGKALHVT